MLIFLPSAVRRFQWFILVVVTLLMSALLRADSHPFERKKVLLVNSYHQGYDWSDGISRGVHQILDPQGVQVREIWMDTKRNTSEAFKKQAALKAREIIEDWQPDLVIAADDNASKYLIVPYYLGSELPVLFCGINWDASVYGYPAPNVTGMVEISLVKPLLQELRQFARGDRVGVLTGTVLSDVKNVANFKRKLGIDFKRESYALDFAQWKKQFIELQQQVDILLLENSRGILDWDNDQAKAHVLEYTRIPTGSTQPGMVPFSLLSYSQIPEEQGEYVATLALRIFAGAKPADIPLVTNQQAQVWANLKIAEKLGVVFPLSLLKNAQVYR